MRDASGSGDRRHSRSAGNAVEFVTIRDLFVGEMDSDIADIVAEFYDASIDGSSWQPALKRLVHAFDADACAVIRRNFGTAEAQIIHAYGLDKPAQIAYAKRFAREDIWVSDESRYHPGTAFLGADVAPESALIVSSMHREWLAPRGLLHAVFIALQRDGRVVTYVMLLRKAVKAPFAQREHTFAQALGPRLAAAYRIGGDLARERAERLMAFEALDAMPTGIIIVDRRGDIVHANRFAQAIIAGGEGVMVTDSGITLERPGHRIRIVDLINHVESGRGSSTVVEPITYSLPRYRHQRPLTCMLMCAGSRGDRPIPAEGAAAILFIGDPERPIAFEATRISRLYGLSRAEARVAALLARGFRLEEAADSLGIAYETVRKHLKQIFVKTNVSRQAELIRMLVTGPAGLAVGGTQPSTPSETH